MAQSISSPLDFQKLEALQVRLHQSSGDPSTPVDGQVWYDTADNRFKYRRSGVTKTLAHLDEIISATFDNPVASAVGDTMSQGVDTDFARADHRHAREAYGAVVTETAFGQSAANGTATTVPHGDHTHGTPTHDGAAHSAISISSLAVPTADVPWNAKKITGLLDPTAAQDAATKAYVDAAAAGIDWKASVRAATTAAGTLASSFENGDVIDGVTLATGNRILIKDQAAGAENGIYTVNATGAPTRATDADVSAEVTAGMAVFVEEGTANADSGWVLTTNAAITLGSTALVFTQFTGLGVVTAGAGLTKTGNTLDVGAGVGIVANANDVAVNTASGGGLKFAIDVGDGVTTSIVVTHSLGTKDVHVTVWENGGSFREVIVEKQHTSTSAISLVFAVAPTTNQYRCLVSLL